MFWCAPQPGWYIAPAAYVCAVLAPPVVLTVVGVAAMLAGPTWLALLMMWAVPINVAASLGDVCLVGWLWRQGRRGRVRWVGDAGAGIAVYGVVGSSAWNQPLATGSPV